MSQPLFWPRKRQIIHTIFLASILYFCFLGAKGKKMDPHLFSETIGDSLGWTVRIPYKTQSVYIKGKGTMSSQKSNLGSEGSLTPRKLLDIKLKENQLVKLSETKNDFESEGFITMGHSQHLFVRYSAYRDSPSTIFVVGLASKPLQKKFRKPVKECVWRPEEEEREPPSEVVPATVIRGHPQESHGLDYEVVVVKCDFRHDIRGGGRGELLLRVPLHPDIPEAAILPEDSLTPVYRETSFVPHFHGGENHLKYKYVMCGAPLYGNISAIHIKQWFLWYKSIFGEKMHFFIYDAGGVDGEVEKVLNVFVEEGIVTFVDVRKQSNFEGWLANQVLFLVDCVHRTRRIAQWAFNFDYDEFLFIKNPSTTIENLLENNSDEPFLTFGSWWYSINFCSENSENFDSDSPQDWAAEKMHFRQKIPNCKLENENPHLCLYAEGHRKWGTNLRMTLMPQIHWIMHYQSSKLGVNIHTDIAYIAHFRGLAAIGENSCKKNKSSDRVDENKPEGYVKNTEVARRARSFSRQNGGEREKVGRGRGRREGSEGGER